MKLLFDQNISHRILILLASTFPDAKHVRDMNLLSATDKQIWNFAKENGYAIVTFDADFSEFATLFGHPPKVVWLRLGNTSTRNLAVKLAARADAINDFLNDATYAEIATLEVDD